MTKFKKELKVNQVLSKDTKVQLDIVWQPPLTEDETLNDKAKEYIKKYEKTNRTNRKR